MTFSYGLIFLCHLINIQMFKKGTHDNILSTSLIFIMEKEIADILLRGELPILPPESFVSNKDEGGEEESGQYDSSDISKEKQRKIKRKQFFRRQGLKRQKEKARLMAATPSFDFVLCTIKVLL